MAARYTLPLGERVRKIRRENNRPVRVVDPPTPREYRCVLHPDTPHTILCVDAGHSCCVDLLVEQPATTEKDTTR